MWGFWISYCGTTDLSGPTYNYLRPVGTKLINIFRAHMIGYIITSTKDESCGIITVWVRYLFYFGGLGCVCFTNITEKRINRFSRNCQDMSGIIQETVVKIRGSSRVSGSDFFYFSQVFVRLLHVWSDCFTLLIYELGLLEVYAVGMLLDAYRRSPSRYLACFLCVFLCNNWTIWTMNILGDILWIYILTKWGHGITHLWGFMERLHVFASILAYVCAWQLGVKQLSVP